jgi:hypothetical protein
MTPDLPAGEVPDEHVYRYRVVGPDAERLRTFIADSGADASCRPVAVRSDAGLTVQLLLTRAQLGRVRASRAGDGLVIDEVEDVTAAQQAARAEVGPGNRFAQRGAVPHGLGRKE